MRSGRGSSDGGPWRASGRSVWNPPGGHCRGDLPDSFGEWKAARGTCKLCAASCWIQDRRGGGYSVSSFLPHRWDGAFASFGYLVMPSTSILWSVTSLLLAKGSRGYRTRRHRISRASRALPGKLWRAAGNRVFDSAAGVRWSRISRTDGSWIHPRSGAARPTAAGSSSNIFEFSSRYRWQPFVGCWSLRIPKGDFTWTISLHCSKLGLHWWTMWCFDGSLRCWDSRAHAHFGHENVVP